MQELSIIKDQHIIDMALVSGLKGYNFRFKDWPKDFAISMSEDFCDWHTTEPYKSNKLVSVLLKSILFEPIPKDVELVEDFPKYPISFEV